MKAPIILGCPLWRGLTKRIAKKHLPSWFRDKAWIASLANFKKGDLINDCSGYNVKIHKIEPCYQRVGNNGFVLIDADITINEFGGLCSLISCGVSPALPREVIISQHEQLAAHSKESGDEWGFAKRWEFTTVDENGMAIIDRQALKDKYGT